MKIRSILAAVTALAMGLAPAAGQVANPKLVQMGVTAPGATPRQFCAYSIAGQCFAFMQQDPVSGALTSLAAVGAGAVTDLSVASNAGIQASKLAATYPFTGAVPQSVNDIVSRTVYLDAGLGAAADGVTDDTAAANNALSLMTPGGILQLRCDRSYRFNGVVQVIGAFRVRQCAERPAVVYDQTSLGFPGSDLSWPHVILGPSGTFNLARGGNVSNMFIVASSITSLTLPDASTFAGTALTQAAGGLGLDITAHDLVILGFNKCYDGSNGGATVNFRNIVADCVYGFNFGPSPGASYIDSLQIAPFLTSQFPGYNLTAVTGNGAATTVNYVGPVITPGNLINFLNASIPGILNNVPYKVTSSTGTSSQTSASTATFANTGLNGTGTVAGVAQNYNPQYYRQVAGQTTYGYLFTVRSDDTHFGDIGDFGHDVTLDAQSSAFLSGKHIWCDNNNVACVRNGGIIDLSIGDVTALNVFNGYVAAPGGPQLISTHFGKLWAGSTFGDCVAINAPGTLVVGNLHCDHVGTVSGGYALDIASPTAYVMVTAGTFDHLSSGEVFSNAPQDQLFINAKWTDAPTGATVYSGAVAPLPSIASAATIQPPANLDKATVTGTATITSIGGAFSGRELTLDCTAACVFSSSGGIAGFTIAPKAGATTITGPGTFKFFYSAAAAAWKQE